MFTSMRMRVSEVSAHMVLTVRVHELIRFLNLPPSLPNNALATGYCTIFGSMIV